MRPPAELRGRDEFIAARLVARAKQMAEGRLRVSTSTPGGSCLKWGEQRIGLARKTTTPLLPKIDLRGMTLEKAVEVLNRHGHNSISNWWAGQYRDGEGWVEGPDPHGGDYFTEFEAIAVAEKYERWFGKG